MTVATVQRRYCVVTPYYKEERALLERCFGSVRRQVPHVDHIVVADGLSAGMGRHASRPPRQARPPAWRLRQRRTRPRCPHGDREGYDGIAFLDADNWYDDDHLASCVAAAESGQDIAYVVAQRRFCRPDASGIAGTPADAPHSEHVDTNCYLFLRSSFAHLHRWCTIPQGLSAYGDQIFGKILRAANLPTVIVGHRTVNYLCMSESIYQQMGETPPPGCKPIIRWRDAQAWIHALPPAERQHLECMTGLTVAQIDPAGSQPSVAEPEPTPEVAPPTPVTDIAHLVVELPGTALPARLRRTAEDIGFFKRVFLEGLYATVGLPAEANLIVDAAAGIGIAALHLHARYPEATVVAVEPDAAAFQLLASNLDKRTGCSAVHARIVTAPGQLSADETAGVADHSRPVLTLHTLLQHFGNATIDLLRLAPEQWQAVSLADLMALQYVRAVLIDTSNGPECIVVPETDLTDATDQDADTFSDQALLLEVA